MPKPNHRAGAASKQATVEVSAVAGVKQPTFEDLARLPALAQYEANFRKATGVSLRLVPPEPGKPSPNSAPCENAFCGLVRGKPAGCAACLETEARLQSAAAKRLTPQQGHCFAGLTIVAVPVVVEGQHVATLVSGQVLRREPTERDFLMLVKMVQGGLDSDWEKRARRAYFEVPVIRTDRFQAVVELLKVFAQYVAESASRCAVACSDHEPSAVASAKQFVQERAAEPITLTEVVEHVHVSRFYFCKLFKRVTGMTLSEYIARVRVEKAKELLADPSLRITEVLFAAGFGSIPRFNSLFKRLVGVSATQYRAQLRSESPV